jgi:quercetin dioxygenase-like cupin family protein
MIRKLSWRRAAASVLGIALSLLAAVAMAEPLAQNTDAGIALLPSQIEYKGLPGTLQTATLFGDPTKAEMYVQRIKLPAGLKLMPHYHPDAPRTVIVLSGTLYYARGTSWDEGKLQAFPAGTFFTEPLKVPHYAWAKDGEVILQLTAIGPTGVALVEAPD